jgi:hypothetical protein
LKSNFCEGFLFSVRRLFPLLFGGQLADIFNEKANLFPSVYR